MQLHLLSTIQATAPTNAWIDINHRNVKNTIEPFAIGSIYGRSDSLLKENPIFSTPIGNNECIAAVQSVNTILNSVSGNYSVANLAVPDNITPTGINNIHAIGFDLSSPITGNNDRTGKCTPDLEANATDTTPIFMRDGKELRIQIYGKHDKEPYYFSPRDNILQAQKVPICTRDNFNTTTQTLKGTLEMCYGKNGNDMVIISKRLMGFYGTADTVTEPAPANKIDFTGTPATQPNTPANPNNDSDEYTALLKRLYLPAI